MRLSALPALSAPTPAIDLHGRVFPILDRRLDPGSRAPLAVALSGGGDSVALLALTAAWAAPQGRKVLALTVDHGLQADSPSWSAFAHETATRLAAAWRGLAWTGPKPASGLPAAARAARHALIADAARAAGATVVMFAQTLDDLREGETMRATEGTTLGRVREWGPSPAWPEGREVFLLRPLLGVTRAELRAFLGDQELGWIEDPANDDLRFARARARRRLAGGGLIEVSTIEADEPTRRAALAAPVDASGTIRIARATPLTAAFLSAACLCAAGGTRPPRRHQIARLLARLDAEPAFVAALAGARIEADETEVRFLRDAGETARGGLAAVQVQPGRASIWDGRFEVGADQAVEIRAAKGLLSQLDSKERAGFSAFPAAARSALPVVIDGGRIYAPFAPVLAVQGARVRCLVGPRLAAACGVAAHEEQIVSVTRGVGVTASLC